MENHSKKSARSSHQSTLSTMKGSKCVTKPSSVSEDKVSSILDMLTRPVPQLISPIKERKQRDMANNPTKPQLKSRERSDERHQQESRHKRKLDQETTINDVKDAKRQRTSNQSSTIATSHECTGESSGTRRSLTSRSTLDRDLRDQSWFGGNMSYEEDKENREYYAFVQRNFNELYAALAPKNSTPIFGQISTNPGSSTTTRRLQKPIASQPQQKPITNQQPQKPITNQQPQNPITSQFSNSNGATVTTNQRESNNHSTTTNYREVNTTVTSNAYELPRKSKQRVALKPSYEILAVRPKVETSLPIESKKQLKNDNKRQSTTEVPVPTSRATGVNRARMTNTKKTNLDKLKSVMKRIRK